MRILFTGGGTGGHIFPNLAVIDRLKAEHPNAEILYVGNRSGMERDILSAYHVPFRGIFSGKLRRYVSLRTLVDLFKIPIGFAQAYCILRRFRPEVIFSKGGYVSVPVVVAARRMGIPVVLHESDTIPGLANRLCARSADTICLAYEEAASYFPREKTVVTGIPVRAGLLRGDAANGRRLTGFRRSLPVVLVIGGSQGAERLNALVEGALSLLLPHLQIIHLCGPGKPLFLPPEHLRQRYYRVAFATQDLPHFFAAADLIVSRAGANAIAEILALKKPNILVPLSTASSDHQWSNARVWEARKVSVVLDETSLNPPEFAEKILEFFRSERLQNGLLRNLKEFPKNTAAETIVSLLKAKIISCQA